MRLVFRSFAIRCFFDYSMRGLLTDHTCCAFMVGFGLLVVFCLLAAVCFVDVVVSSGQSRKLLSVPTTQSRKVQEMPQSSR